MTRLFFALLTLFFLSGPAMGENSDFRRCTNAAKGIAAGEQVTATTIRNAMQDAPLLSQQAGGVSLPRVQQYVDKLLRGEIAPAIKVDGKIIVDGNHRYVAGRILGQEPTVMQWPGGKPDTVIPWNKVPVSPEAW